MTGKNGKERQRDRMATMKDIAQSARVSTATVSRVLNGAPNISPATAARVMAVMEELRYRPNQVARSLRTVSTRTLGVLVSNMANPFFASLVDSIEDQASELDLGLILGNASEQSTRQLAYLHAFMEKQVDGIIVTPTGSSSEWAQEILDLGVPLVFVDRTLKDIEVPSVTTDDARALRELIVHFKSEGHRSAALITGPLANMPIRHRIAGFLNTAEELDFEVKRSHVIEGGVSRADGERALSLLLSSPGPMPDVIFTLNNTMALGTLTGLRKAGVSIPDEIALASYDDSPWFDAFFPGVTAIAQPVSDMGRVAVDLIAEIVSGKPGQSIALPASMIVRDSSRAKRSEGAKK